MSVNKFHVRRSQASYTTIPNNVIEGLKTQLELLGLYMYMLHMPPVWVFYKKELQATLRIGQKKLERYIAQLAQMRLIRIAQMRSENGRFVHNDIEVLDGTEFKINDLENAQSTMSQYPYRGNGGTDMDDYKENMDKTNSNQKNKDQKLSSASDDAGMLDDMPLFTIFWSLYPKKKDRLRAMEVWKKKKLEQNGQKIITCLEFAVKNDVQWRDKQFVPEATRWLRNERWHDEVVTASDAQCAKPLTPMERAGRMLSSLKGA